MYRCSTTVGMPLNRAMRALAHASLGDAMDRKEALTAVTCFWPTQPRARKVEAEPFSNG